MERSGIRAYNPYHHQPSPLKQFRQIAGFILRIICAIFFVILIHYCVTKDSSMRKVPIEQEVTEIDPASVAKLKPKPEEKQDLIDYSAQSQEELTTQLKECRETAKLNDLLDIRKFRNRANIYECQIACLYPAPPQNIFQSLEQYIHSTPKLNPEDPGILIQDVPRHMTSKWKFDPELTILHIEFNKAVLPETVIFEYSSDLRSLFMKQEIRVKLIGVIHNSEESLLKMERRFGVIVKQVEIDDYFLEKKDEFSRYTEHYEQTIMARTINYPEEVQCFKAIRIEIYSATGKNNDQTKGFSFSRIKIMDEVIIGKYSLCD